MDPGDDEDEPSYADEDHEPPEFGCCLPPGECCAAGLHFPSECHTADDYEAEMMMNRNDAIDLARAHALAHGQTGDHAYLPTTDAEASEWLPHAWVVDAIISAAEERERASDTAGFQARYRLPGCEWSSWGHVVCGVKGHEMELREVSGDERRHIVCLCPDCATPSSAAIAATKEQKA